MDADTFPTKRPTFMPRTVVGFHGCTRDIAVKILSENRLVTSTNTYDWLGEGIYFWEYAPYRALDWAQALCARHGGKPAVIGVTIRLGRCLNLLDTRHSDELIHAYRDVEQRYTGRRLPRNLDSGAYMLDCAVVDTYCDLIRIEGGAPYQTVRGSYPEGEPVYPGSKILSLAHTQIAVRDASCLSRLHLVQFG